MHEVGDSGQLGQRWQGQDTDRLCTHLDFWGSAELRGSIEQGTTCLGFAEAGRRGAGRVHRKWHQEAGSPSVVP